MRQLLIILCLCSLPLVTYGQSVTFDLGNGTPQTYTYTPADVADMTRLMEEINRQRQANNPPLPPWTIEEWKMFVEMNALTSYRNEVKPLYAKDGCEIFKREASAETKAEILSHFGGKNICP